MKHEPDSSSCPKCHSSSHIRNKLVMIDAELANDPRFNLDDRVTCSCNGNFSVADLRPEFRNMVESEQFIEALYCEACDVSFIPKHMAKPEPQRFKLSELGWHPVNADGSLGPPQETMRGQDNGAQGQLS